MIAHQIHQDNPLLHHNASDLGHRFHQYNGTFSLSKLG